MMGMTETFDKLVIEQLPTWEHNREFDTHEEKEDELRYAQMMMPMLNHEDEVYDDFEEGIVNDALEDVHLQANDDATWKTLGKNEQFPRMIGKKTASDERVKRVKGSAIIPCSPEKMLAWTFAFNSNYDMSLHHKANGTNSDEYPNVVLNLVNPHHHIVYYAMKVPYPLQPRSFLCRGVWKRTDEDTYVFVYKTPQDGDRDVPADYAHSTKKVIPSVYEATWVIRRMKNNFCHCTYMVMADIKGNVPAAILNHGAAGALEKLKRAHAYFSKTNTVDYDEKELREEMKQEELDFAEGYGVDGVDKDGGMVMSVSTRRSNTSTISSIISGVGGSGVGKGGGVKEDGKE
ncbi:hypothetical protein TrLO_g3584 [Triparma laevis f. longispina]|uniref:START domain-containing protein n=1 Tax=Triparma laevis f. longispina TaxID=1714387 RepID=A0A9W6ZFJ3_9STRA|nr:hypothetical protein TrLO_g3584 [Triparma laevis f. longispina]